MNFSPIKNIKTKPGGEMLGQVDPMSSMTQGFVPAALESVPLPFLPPSKNAARFISRASKIDPRYVDLELVGARVRSHQKRMRGLLYSCGMMLALAGTAGVVWFVSGAEKRFPDGHDLVAVQQHFFATESAAPTIRELDLSKAEQGIVSGSRVAVHSLDQADVLLKDAGPDAGVGPANSSEQAVNVAVVPAESSLVKPTRAIEDYGLDELLAEGQRFLKYGDVTAARLFFQRAADQGLARAALAMGSTYDPKALLASGLSTVTPDESIALKWYRRAHVLADRSGKN